jgi:hypothetical protein
MVPPLLDESPRSNPCAARTIALQDARNPVFAAPVPGIPAGFRISAHRPIEKPRSILLRFENLVTVTRDLANAAINSPITTQAQDLTNAKNELVKGDQAQLNGQTESAIEHYRDAWMFASKSGRD